MTLLLIVDPVGTSPIFVGLTRLMSPGERQRAALRAVLAAGLLVIGFALFGEVVRDYLGVSVESLSIAGVCCWSGRSAAYASRARLLHEGFEP